MSTSTPATGTSSAGTGSRSVAEVPGWTLETTEDFDRAAPVGSFPGSTYGSGWFVYPDGTRDTSGRGVYHPSSVLSVHDGYLDVALHVENGVPQVAAAVPRVPSTQWGQLYGRYSVRYRADAAPGFKIAFLLWPDDDTWPEHGEVDYPEGDLGSSPYAALIHASKEYTTSGAPSGVSMTDWHVATTEWSPGKLVWYLDGRKIGEAVTGVPSTPMHWVLQSETTIQQEDPDPTRTAHVQVDWISIHSLPR